LIGHAQRTASPLRFAPPPLHHPQLLPTAAAVHLSARVEFVCRDFGRSARPLRVRARGVRRHAQSHSPAHQRTGQGHSFHRPAGLEAARVAAAPSPATQKVSIQQLRLPFRHAHDFLPQFWQPRFYDFNVWSQTKFVEKLHYMHMNPVKRKLVAHPRDWPWSSFSFYAKKESGLVRIDPVR